MKIAALSPQFVFEVPPSEEAAEAKRVARELRELKLAGTEATSETDQASLDDETREGLKRLSQLIRKKDQKKGQKKDQAGNDDSKDKKRRGAELILESKKRKAFLVYQTVASLRSDEDDKGVSIDKKI